MAVRKKKKTDTKQEERMMLLVILLGAAIFLGLINLGLKDGQQETVKRVVQVPQTGELFACGDFCPGPREQYLKRVYVGVKSQEECISYGGKWDSFTGWGVNYYCEVK